MMSGMKSGYVLDYLGLADNIDNYFIEFHEKSDEDVL
jgi:type I site-specific restriction-modification system R (restriction) subunit